MEENNSALLRRLVVRHFRDGRRQYDDQVKRELVEACLQPGVSVAKLADEHAINANLLRRWIVQYQREIGDAPAQVRCAPALVSAFIPVVASTATVPVTIPTLRARLPNGIEIDANCAARDDLLSLLQMLCELPCSASTQG